MTSVIVWIIVDVYTIPVRPLDWHVIWNAGIRWVNFSIFAIIIGSLRSKIEKEKHIQEELQKTMNQLEEKVKHIEELRGQIKTVCAWTHRIKDEGKWISFEEYFSKHFDLKFSHGISEEGIKDFLNDSSSK